MADNLTSNGGAVGAEKRSLQLKENKFLFGKSHVNVNSFFLRYKYQVFREQQAMT
jgi:hypothetical protein